jgi:glycosyltransferase involved in cell wall biosynthesis
MTVLHVAAGNGYGGIERMLVTLAGTPHPILAQHFVVAFGGRFERELLDAGAAVHRLPSPRASRPLMIWRARREFTRVLESVDPGSAIFHGAWPHAMFAAAARAAGVRVGFWQHQPIARAAWPDRWARRVRPDFAVFNSAFTQSRPAFPDVCGSVIHCPVPPPREVDPSTRRRLRTGLGAADDDVVVLMAARLEKTKGHELLLAAARTLPPALRLHFWIAGGVQRPAEARYLDQLATLASAPDLKRTVSLLGDRDDVSTLMRLADIYCQPNTRGEGFGIAIAEAMRAGLPCVVSAAGGAAELLDDSCAVLAEPGDVAGIADALRELAGDAGRREAMGRAAIVRASQLTDPAGRLDALAAVLSAQAA